MYACETTGDICRRQLLTPELNEWRMVFFSPSYSTVHTQYFELGCLDTDSVLFEHRCLLSVFFPPLFLASLL